MRPLSTINYFLKNKKKVLSSIIIIIIAICLVYIMECFVASIVQSIYPLDAKRFEYASLIMPTDAVPEIPEATIASLETSENIESIIPVTIRQIAFSVPGSTTHTALFSASPEDLPILIDKYQVWVSEGRLPKEGADEVAIDANVAKNNDLQIGSKTKLDMSHNLYVEYTVVGIVNSDSHISFVGSPTIGEETLNYSEKGHLVFPAAGRFEQAEDEVKPLGRQGLSVLTLSIYQKLFAANNQTFRLLDTMVVLAIIVMVVCLVCSKYAQFHARKSEIGVLYALGYTRKEIARRTFFEVAFANIIAFAVGVIIAIILSKEIMTAVFENIGGTGVFFSGKAIVLSLLAPVLTTIFTLLPVNRLIKRMDAISIITNH